MPAGSKSQALEPTSQTSQAHNSILAMYLADHFFSDLQVFCPPIIHPAPIFSGLLISLGAFAIIQCFPPKEPLKV